MKDTFKTLGIASENPGTYAGKWLSGGGKFLGETFSPIDGSVSPRVLLTSLEQYETVIQQSVQCFEQWRMVPAPKRGELIRGIADELRRHKQELGALICYETGKILSEGLGEVQEAIDIADFAVGLSRQLYGLSMHSERPMHRMYEQWHPLGPIGVITAFNFPLAVWAWNAMIAAVCGDTIVWKPSELTPLSAIAATKICESVTAKAGYPELFTLLTGDGPSLGEHLAKDPRLPLISATGSCGMGKSVAQTVAARLGRSLLELGGNNAIIVLGDADLDLAVRGIVFGAVGTAGQRCTSTRRVLIEKSIYPQLSERLIKAYKQVKIGNPLESGTLMGPLISQKAVKSFQAAVARAKSEGAKILFGGELASGLPSANYVQPTLIEAPAGLSLLTEETFAPILYLRSVDTLEAAIAEQNAVPQGLSSAIFTRNLHSAEKFLAATGSDCGIANVNIGTSGAEIGGAFGGEKETGGGREAGSDSWKAYMRRQTSTINWSSDLPLAQGIKFDL